MIAILLFPFFFFKLTAAVEYYYIGPDQLTDFFIDETVIFGDAGYFSSTKKTINCRSQA